MYRSIIFALVCACFLAGCLPSPVYQKQYAIPKNQWDYAYKPSFKFEITDTTSLYNIYFLVRHTEAYPFSNIWLQIHTKGPGDTTFKTARIEVPLAEPSGKWLGRGMGEISEQRMPITMEGDTAILRRKGTWEIKLEQNMRINPLPDVLQVGLRVEKANRTSNY
jgi:gliding motility-associated lipoprotein GldH